MSRSYRFTHAICRSPAQSVTDGLRAVDHGAPDAAQFNRDHEDYVAALRDAGVDVTVLPALEAFPDSVFVEDPALILDGTAILLAPSAPSRAGEAAAIAQDLARLTRGVIPLQTSGGVDGGDILAFANEIWVGLSDRTDRQGCADLAPIARDLGYGLRVVETPADILHFKTECGLLDDDTVLATPRLAATGVFDGLRVIETAPGEDPASNAIRVNDTVFLARGFPATADRLTDAGYNVVALPNEQAALVDGGLSCMSLRYALDPSTCDG